MFPQLDSKGTAKPDKFNSNIYTYHKTRPQVSREGTRNGALTVEMVDHQMGTEYLDSSYMMLRIFLASLCYLSPTKEGHRGGAAAEQMMLYKKKI